MNVQTHKSVNNENIFFQVPQIGDIVTAFGRPAVITQDFSDETRKVFDFKSKIPFEVIFTDKESKPGMAFRSEIKVIKKRIDNWNVCKINEINAKSKAQAVFNI